MILFCTKMAHKFQNMSLHERVAYFSQMLHSRRNDSLGFTSISLFTLLYLRKNVLLVYKSIVVLQVSYKIRSRKLFRINKKGKSQFSEKKRPLPACRDLLWHIVTLMKLSNENFEVLFISSNSLLERIFAVHLETFLAKTRQQ